MIMNSPLFAAGENMFASTFTTSKCSFRLFREGFLKAYGPVVLLSKAITHHDVPGPSCRGVLAGLPHTTALGFHRGSW